MIHIRSLEHTSLDTIYTVWEAAFAGYVSSWNRQELEQLLQRRGYHPQLSFGAFEADRLLSFTLNGVGRFNDLPTAYDTGTGTLPDYRGQGLASKIFRHSVPHLIQAGVRQYLLEVLVDNQPAVQLYQQQGFAITRNFHCFRQEMQQLQLADRSLLPGYDLRSLSITPDLLASGTAFWDYQPSWQNSIEAILRKPNDFVAIGTYHQDTLCGYGVLEPATGDITQLAVHPAHRRQGLGTGILYALLLHNKCGTTKAINVALQSVESTAFLRQQGYEPFAQQHEMLKVLS